MQLFIDTTDNKKAIVKVGEVEITKSYKSPRSQDILGLINEALKKANIEKEDLTAIRVNPGPGAFTSTRVGVAVANALGLALKIPLNGQQVGEIVKPIYEKEFSANPA
jgi:tRNA A37 threonylcarbamoyladenosine modification protein TsaB